MDGLPALESLCDGLYNVILNGLQSWSKTVSRSFPVKDQQELSNICRDLVRTLKMFHECPTKELDDQMSRLSDQALVMANKHSKAMTELTWGIRLKLASDIATGMCHLHGADPPLLHRDLKSPNVLLTQNFQSVLNEELVARRCGSRSVYEEPLAKIADFGLSRRLFGTSLKGFDVNVSRKWQSVL